MRLFDPETPLQTPERILIVRLSALGDTIHGLPALNALRDAFPKAFIAWVVEGRSADILEGHSALDHLIRLPRKWWKSLSQIRQLRQTLRDLHFDTTVDLQCLTKSAVLAKLSGASRRLGCAGRSGRELSKWFNNVLTDVSAGHVIEHYLGILKPLGISQPQVRFELPERPEDAAFADDTIVELGLKPQRFVALNPGAAWPSKIWPVERYGALAMELECKHGLTSLAFWGGPNELPLAERIVDTSGGHARLAPATSLGQLAALARRARIFIGSDTGPVHLAVATGVPTISLHGVSRAEWCGAYGRQNIALQAYHNGDSLKMRNPASGAAMRTITITRVSRACDELLASNASPASISRRLTAELRTG